MKRSFLKSLTPVLIFSLFIVSCSQQDEVFTSQLAENASNRSARILACPTTGIFRSDTASPFNPSSFEARYFDFAANMVVGSSSASRVAVFTGVVNSTIAPSNGYTMYYFSSTSSLCDITSIPAGSSTALTIGEQTDGTPGWFIYNATNDPEPLADFYVGFVKTGSPTVIVKLTGFPNAGSSGSGGSLLIWSDVAFTHKTL